MALAAIVQRVPRLDRGLPTALSNWADEHDDDDDDGGGGGREDAMEEEDGDAYDREFAGGGGAVSSAASAATVDDAEAELRLMGYDDLWLPQELFPRLATMSVLDAERCVVYVTELLGGVAEWCMPGMRLDEVHQLLRLLQQACRLHRYALVTLAFWWLVHSFEPLRHVVRRSELQHTLHDQALSRGMLAAPKHVPEHERALLMRDIDAKIGAMRTLVEMVRTASFEPFNVWPTLALDFWAIAHAVVIREHAPLTQGLAAITVYEKMPKEHKEEIPDASLVEAELGRRRLARRIAAGLA